MKRLTILIEDQIHHALKVRALRKKITMTDLVTLLITEELTDTRDEKEICEKVSRKISEVLTPLLKKLKNR